MGDEHNSSFMHTILGRGGRFYCNNLRRNGRMIGTPGKYLAIGTDGTLSNDTWRYMRHIDRCYRIRTVAVPDEETEIRRLKRERSQHADFRGAEVMASTKTIATSKRAVRHRPQWASASDPVCRRTLGQLWEFSKPGHWEFSKTRSLGIF